MVLLYGKHHRHSLPQNKRPPYTWTVLVIWERSLQILHPLYSIIILAMIQFPNLVLMSYPHLSKWLSEIIPSHRLMCWNSMTCLISKLSRWVWTALSMIQVVIWNTKNVCWQSITVLPWAGLWLDCIRLQIIILCHWKTWRIYKSWWLDQLMNSLLTLHMRISNFPVGSQPYSGWTCLIFPSIYLYIIPDYT